VLDQLWKDHLLQMDHLKEGIGLRGYGQHDPLIEYKRESFTLFEEMMEHFEEETVRYLYLMRVVDENGDEVGYPLRVATGPNNGNDGAAEVLQYSGPQQVEADAETRAPRRMQTSLDEVEKQFQRRKSRELEQAKRAGSGQTEAVQQVVRGTKVGRNDPCPCGSGKKYKKCHGANE
jgi:preprotein translocase subunit SecA